MPIDKCEIGAVVMSQAGCRIVDIRVMINVVSRTKGIRRITHEQCLGVNRSILEC